MNVLKKIRMQLVTRPLFKLLKSRGLLPSISKTEKTALRAGDVWMEGDLFSGHPDFTKIFAYPYPKLSEEEQAFLDNEVEELCSMTDDWEVFQKRDLPETVWEYIKKNRFLGMIIPKEYGGLGFSAYGHSCVIEKLATRSQVLAITVMVPNSLGPAELLLHYGLDNQKEHYLPRLADGREIPCFALTEPEAGSDATSIQSSGTVFKDSDGELKIRLQFEKRYITLGSIATVIGLAFVLKDPENLLGMGEDPGITCGLVDAAKEGVDQSRRHDPLGVPFVNAPLVGTDVIIGIDDIIGGRAGAGKGWEMLMESLAVGRGISLPSTSSGGSKMAVFVASAYSSVRYQFGIAIGRFEGVAEVLGRMGARTYLLDAAKTFTIGAIDQGEKPTVANAIMKYQSTEKFRTTILDAMDILGGAAISIGPKNLLAHAYFGAPIAITVEGANIMTRTLIQFGQGVIRCHPYVFGQIEALEKEDIETFDTLFFAHVRHMLANGFRTFLLGISRGHLHRPGRGGITNRYEQKLAWASAQFAFLSDVVLTIMGAGLKRRESLSGRFADILAQMYMMTATLRRFKEEGERREDEVLLRVALSTGFNRIDEAFAGICHNVSGGAPGLLFRLIGFVTRLNGLGSVVKDADLHTIAARLTTNPAMRDRLCSNIHTGGRAGELRTAAQAMLEVKSALSRLKNAGEQALDQADRDLISRARNLQHEIIAVDSYSSEEFFPC
ncbi:MAG TPA: acyl-CoA dehydrogenase [Desulfobulbus sp.]|nr:acyl-CoA dehydrogenase [Desulfobulbus sp.]